MENLIASAFTFLEFNKSFHNYASDPLVKRDYTTAQIKYNWGEVIRDYHKVSQYLSDDALRQAQDLVMGEF